MTVRWLGVCVAATLMALGAVLSAHHSTAAYENTTIILRNATMVGVTWANPHTILTFAVKDAKGETATWNAESGSPSGLRRMGWNRNSLRSGDAVSVELFPARNGAKVGRLSKVILPDGKELLDSLATAEAPVK